ncbi:hypothetical protein RUND412_004103 [Rhizina undulata]
MKIPITANTFRFRSSNYRPSKAPSETSETAETEHECPETERESPEHAINDDSEKLAPLKSNFACRLSPKSSGHIKATVDANITTMQTTTGHINIQAARDLPTDTVILTERPLIMLTKPYDCKSYTHALLKAVSMLTPRELAVFKSLPKPAETGETYRWRTEVDHIWHRNVFWLSPFQRGVFATISRIGHSCDANAIWEWKKGVLSIKTIQPVAEGEEITICYASELKEMPREDRRSKLMREFGFECRCSKCVVEERSEKEIKSLNKELKNAWIEWGGPANLPRSDSDWSLWSYTEKK